MFKTKRLVALSVTAAVLTGVLFVFEFVVAPRKAGAAYSEAVRLYNLGERESAFDLLRKALWYSPKDAGVNTLMGWCYWGNGSVDQAKTYFLQALRSDPDSADAKYGLALTRLATGEAPAAVSLLQDVLEGRPGDPEVLLQLADALVLSGQTQTAAVIYRELIQQDPRRAKARKAFRALFGYEEFEPGLPYTIQEKPRPSQSEVCFRTYGDYIQVFEKDDWKTIYITGVNLGPARPGESVTTASNEFHVYRKWLDQISAMNANTVRVYTILSPAFYQAFADFNRDSESPLWLIQEVWLDDSVTDLYEASARADFEQEITWAVDVLQGQAEIPCKSGRYCGIYTSDISSYVVGLTLGREIEPHLAVETNARNPDRTSYDGVFVSLSEGNPTETWFAEVLDFAARYEYERYNSMRPLSIVNWPPLDPMHHISEASLTEEAELRKSLPSDFRWKAPGVGGFDIVSLDVTKFTVSAPSHPGLFANYHVYQHWPDFIFLESKYADSQDRQGPNPYLGYLEDLKSHHSSMPLLIGEYGVSTSVTPTHLHPQGWHSGGLSETQQSALLTRFTENIHNARCAGGIVFEWQDEWWKSTSDPNTQEFELPRDHDVLWHNRLDPEENFGIVKYVLAQGSPLPMEDPGRWSQAQVLYESPGSEGPPFRHLRRVLAASDFAFLHLRIEVEEAGFVQGKQSYLIALNTLSELSGSRALPGGEARIPSGANFLIRIEAEGARLLITTNYSPNQIFRSLERPDLKQYPRKRGMSLLLEDESPFEEIVTKVNRLRFGRDGTEYPALEYNRSILNLGQVDSNGEEDSRALWRFNSEPGIVELRLPWGLLLVTDPSSRKVFAGTDGVGNPLTTETSGIEVSVLALQKAEATEISATTVLLDSFPALSEEGKVLQPSARFSWEPWNTVNYTSVFKPAYFALRETFKDLQSRFR